MATIASHTGFILGIAHGSCLPSIFIDLSLPSISIVFCSLAIEGIGFTATLTTISSPLDIPPTIPPALFVRNPFESIWSLLSEPDSPERLNPPPNSTPLTAPMDKRPFPISASSLSKTGSPNPKGTPLATISTTPQLTRL